MPASRDGFGTHFLAGAKAVTPVLIGVLPFALIAGLVSVRLGLSPLAACALSVIVFAGASQLAAVQLIHDGAPLMVILITVLFINLRFTMYSASIAPYFQTARARTRVLVSYLLTDQAYVLSLYGFANRPGLASRVAFYMGVSVPMWLAWQAGTAVGALLGSRIPDSWALDFAIPLTFMALLFPAIRDRAAVVAALVGGVVAVIGHDLPWNLGLMLGALAGIGAGVLASLGSRDEAAS